MVLACAALALAAAAPLVLPAREAPVAPLLSGGDLFRAGETADFVAIAEAGAYRLTVRAAGRAVDDVWPLMGATVNGLAQAMVSVDAAEMRDYAFDLELEAGVHSVGAMLLNPADSLLDPRGIDLDAFALEGPAPAARSDGAAWAAAAQAREQALLDSLDARIRALRAAPLALHVTAADGTPAAGAKISVKQVRHAFLFGASVAGLDQFKNPLQDGNYARLFAGLFNYATVPMYWRYLEPVKGQRNTAPIDAMTAWCRSKGMAMKGHPLLWDSEHGVPPWSKGQPEAAAQRAHVEDLIGRYKDRIAFWEVVNEPANHPGAALEPAHAWARKAAPNATLVVNDYGVLYCNHPPFHALLEDASKRGIPWDAVGIQAHAPPKMAFPLDGVWRTLDRYAALGKPIHITEFIAVSDGSPVERAPWRGVWSEETQAAYAADFYRTCFAHPAVAAISWWDFADRGAWMPGGGMLRDDAMPKPVYERLEKLIKGAWWTRAEGAADAGGAWSAPAFFGAYEITIEQRGARTTRTIDHPQAAPIAIAL